jgi:HTH-type transcriptional regulator/antitoxin HigA
MNYVSPVPIPPGETLKDVLAEKRMTQTGLAMRMGRPIKTINGVVKGDTAITAATAVQLEYALNVPAYFWLNLESAYQTARARRSEREQIESEYALAAKYPYAEMAKLGWAPAVREPLDRSIALRRFFGVASLERVAVVEAVAFRRSATAKNSAHATAAWLRQGETEALKMETADYDEASFKKSIADIKRLAYEMPGDFGARLREICRACGVAVVYVPHLKGTHVNGATRWLTSKKAIIQLSIRYPFEDVFWFSFFHEAGHILLHGKRDIFIDYATGDGSQKDKEADRFAQFTLIGEADYSVIKTAHPFSAAKILALSGKLSISPGVIVGRLRHDGIIGHSMYGALRKKITLALG